MNFAAAVCRVLLFASNGLTAAQQRLRVSANHRYLEYEDGKPFFYRFSRWATRHGSCFIGVTARKPPATSLTDRRRDLQSPGKHTG
jgi:hypothetical protein